MDHLKQMNAENALTDALFDVIQRKQKNINKNLLVSFK